VTQRMRMLSLAEIAMMDLMKWLLNIAAPRKLSLYCKSATSVAEVFALDGSGHVRFTTVQLGPKRRLFCNLNTTAKDGRVYECNHMENVAAGQNGDLRMHQGLLQSGLPSLSTVLKKPCRLRTENG
jgi:hypothetical protein